eukprot:scaffold246413_cov36-Tisochrysis_lutea.AAC.1
MLRAEGNGPLYARPPVSAPVAERLASQHDGDARQRVLLSNTPVRSRAFHFPQLKGFPSHFHTLPCRRQ